MVAGARLDRPRARPHGHARSRRESIEPVASPFPPAVGRETETPRIRRCIRIATGRSKGPGQPFVLVRLSSVDDHRLPLESRSAALAGGGHHGLNRRREDRRRCMLVLSAATPVVKSGSE